MSSSSVKKVCINSSKNYYTGTELSPLHFGLSAEGYDINSIMEGYDKELWIVDIKNNKKIWVKNEHLSRITHEEPVIKSILSSYKNGDSIGDIKTFKFKDNVYSLKDLKEVIENKDQNKTDSINDNNDAGCHDNDCNLREANNGENKEDLCDNNEDANDYDADVDDGFNGDTVTKKTKVKTIINTNNTNANNDKKPTDYNIFVKFRLNELKDVSKNKKENFENVKIEWRELKKNKSQLKVVMDKAKIWLNEDKK